jgi:transposase
MQAYSQDLRHRVLHAIDAGQSQAVVAKTFSVSVSTIKRSLKQRRERGHVLPKAIPGRPAVKGAVLQAHLQAQLEADPPKTLARSAGRWRVVNLLRLLTLFSRPSCSTMTEHQENAVKRGHSSFYER